MKTIGLVISLAISACQSSEAPSKTPVVDETRQDTASGSAGAPAAGTAGAAGAAVAMVPTTSPYAGDVQRICNALALSGADKDPGGRQVVVANWLASHVETKEGHDYLIEIAGLQGVAKADRLDGEAHKLGLPGCALASMWRVPGAAIGG